MKVPPRSKLAGMWAWPQVSVLVVLLLAHNVATVEKVGTTAGILNSD